jgi:uncharacterized membrane protein
LLLILTTLSQALTPHFSRGKLITERQRERERESKEAMFAAENGLKSDPRLQGISEAIRVVPHFPKQGLNSSLVFFFSFFFFLFSAWLFNFCCCCLTGIMFQDITTLLLDHKVFKDTVDIFVDRYRDMNISVVAGNLSANPFSSSFCGMACLLKMVNYWDKGRCDYGNW